jgi:hypothetical protein
VKKRVYLLKGYPGFPAIRLKHGKDKCGQARYFFIAGDWGGLEVRVEPYKMVKTTMRYDMKRKVTCE